MHALLSLLLAAVVAAGAGSSAAEPAPPPPSGPRVELFTMGQGPFIFHKFGHAALCVIHDDGSREDRCYNYGWTDFSRPIGIGWDFVRGTAEFWVAVTDRESMIRTYVHYDRTIWLQPLPLSPEQARELERRLEHDALEENKYYVYHHFFDNCTTRLRDHIDAVTGGALSRGNGDGIGTTFRELGRKGLADDEWAPVVAMFFLGRGADREISLYEAMFLPDFLRAAVTDRFGVEPIVLYQRRGPALSQQGTSGYTWALLIAFVVAFPVVAARALGRGERLALALSGGLLSLIGLALWGVALVSQVPELRYNEALLVFWPTDLLLAVLRGRRRVVYARARVAALAVVSLLLALGVLRQPLMVAALIPLAPSLITAADYRRR